MKHIAATLILLLTLQAQAQDKGVKYIKAECTGIKYMDKEPLSGEEKEERTEKKNFTIFLDQDNLDHVIIKEGKKTTRYQVDGSHEIDSYLEDDTAYKYWFKFEDGRRLFVVRASGKLIIELNPQLFSNKREHYLVKSFTFDYKE